MLALKIIGGVLLFLLLLLLAAVRVRVAAQNGEAQVSVHYLFFRIRLWPLKPEKPKKEKKKRSKKKKEEADKPEEEEAPKKKKTLEQQLDLVKGILPGVKKALNTLRHHIVLYKVRADLRVARGDAHKTALAYARTASFLAVLFEVLDWLIVLRRPKITVSPDFTREKSSYDFAFRLKIRPLFLLIAGVQALFALLRVGKKTRKKPNGNGRNPNNHTRKGGQAYESAASNR